MTEIPILLPIAYWIGTGEVRFETTYLERPDGTIVVLEAKWVPL